MLLQRLAKWFTTLSPKDKAKIVKDVAQLVLARRTRMCNFLEYKGIPLKGSLTFFHCISSSS
jgi:AP-1 complex subunit sigma 1/2